MKGTAGKEFDHLALRIDLEDIGLADLSFGANFLEPLRLSEMEQQDAAAGLRLIDADERWRLERRQPAARSFVLKMIPDISEQVDDGRNRSDVARGADVSVVLKEDQPTGKQTRGIVQDLLTKSGFHPRGIKVRLQGGKVGRVQVIHSAGHP
jgi:uncharacterized repeat protein (TIGR03833 family)